MMTSPAATSTVSIVAAESMGIPVAINETRPAAGQAVSSC